jgi:hypothetical protein
MVCIADPLLPSSLSIIPCPICIVIARNTKIMALVTSVLGEGPLSSLCSHANGGGRVIISAKYVRKMLSGLQLSFICDALFSFPLWSPVYVCAAPL